MEDDFLYLSNFPDINLFSGLITHSVWRTLDEICESCLENPEVLVVMGGNPLEVHKKLGLFANLNRRSFFVKYQKGETAKQFYYRILAEIGYCNTYGDQSLYYIIKSIKDGLSRFNHKTLLIVAGVDEIPISQIGYLDDLNSELNYNTGFVFFGTIRFKMKLENNIKSKRIVRGIPEFYDRVAIWWLK